MNSSKNTSEKSMKRKTKRMLTQSLLTLSKALSKNSLAQPKKISSWNSKPTKFSFNGSKIDPMMKTAYNSSSKNANLKKTSATTQCTSLTTFWTRKNAITKRSQMSKEWCKIQQVNWLSLQSIQKEKVSKTICASWWSTYFYKNCKNPILENLTNKSFNKIKTTS